MVIQDFPWVEIGDGLSACVVTVTKEIATSLLRHLHEQQRNLSQQSIDGIVADLEAGRFLLTHQGVCLDADRLVIDGQHRLTAVARCGIAARMLLFWNRNASIRDPIDRARPRSVAYLTGRAPKLTASLAAIRSLEAGYDVTHVLTVAESDGVFERHGQTIEELLNSVTGLGSSVAGLIAACTWAAPIDRAAVVEFAEKTITGEMIARGDPSYAYRVWRGANPAQRSWDCAMAALNCLRAKIGGVDIKSVYVSEVGYRAITGRRRSMKIPNTPSTAAVPSDGAHWQ